MISADEARELRQSCTRSLWPGSTDVKTALDSIPLDTQMDVYGSGGVVEELEQTIAGLLGKEAAMFVGTGTMAQLIALKLHCDRTGRQTVLWHHTAHPAIWENDGPARVFGIQGRKVGSPHSLITLDDLKSVPERPAALLLEVPQREIGGQLPTLDTIAEQCAWAKERGAARHLDGARIWEATAGLDCSFSDLAQHFDSVYVSFYKGLGAMSGAALIGDTDFIAKAKEWRHRLGGRPHGLWPGAASALTALRTRLPRFKAYLKHAQAVAAELRTLPGVRIVPDPPQVSMFHMYLDTTPERLDAGIRKAAKDGIFLFRVAFARGGAPGWLCAEIVVAESALAIRPDELRAAVAKLF